MAEANPIIKPSQGRPLFSPEAALYLIRSDPMSMPALIMMIIHYLLSKLNH